MSRLFCPPEVLCAPRVTLLSPPQLPAVAAAPAPVSFERIKVQQTVEYMVGHLAERLNVNQLATRANVSLSHFFVIFKRQTGYAPIDFLIQLRMFCGCLLLEHTPLTVKEVAAALGYDDAFYFSRLFKLVNEVSPRDYRLLPARMRQSLRAAILPHLDIAIRSVATRNDWGHPGDATSTRIPPTPPITASA